MAHPKLPNISETDILYPLIEQLLPCDASEWDEVSQRFNSKILSGAIPRTGDQLKAHFHQIFSTSTNDCTDLQKKARNEWVQRVATQMNNKKQQLAQNRKAVNQQGLAKGKSHMMPQALSPPNPFNFARDDNLPPLPTNPRCRLIYSHNRSSG